MKTFSIQTLLLDNAFEFPITPEWERLLYEEFYVEWMNDDTLLTPLLTYLEEQYNAFIVKDFKQVEILTPVFKSQNIEELPGGKYRVTVQIEGSRVRQTFDTLDAARYFRNELLGVPKVGGLMADAFAASLRDERSTLTAA